VFVLEETNMRARFLHLILALATATMLAAAAAPASAMTFELVSGPAESAQRAGILASGEIDERAASDFQAFRNAHDIGAGALMVLDSAGGDVLQSLRLGNEIRAARLATTVAAYDAATRSFRRGGRCASECAYAFLGGVERSVGAGAKVGVDQIEAGTTASDSMWLESMVATHVSRLGGRLELLIPAMGSPPNDVHWLSAEELSRYAVVTTASNV
jgi:hypothetical protein